MAYNDILTNYKNMLSEKLNRLTCLKDLIYEEVVSEDEDGATTTEYTLTGKNVAYTAISEWLPILINESSYPPYDVIPRIITPSSIDTSTTSLNLYMYYTIMSLFIQLEAEPLSGEAAQKSIAYKRDSETFINQSVECVNQSESKRADAESNRTKAESKRAAAKKSNTEEQANKLNKEADELDKKAYELDKEADELDRESILLISEANVLTTKSEMCKSNAQLYEEKAKDYEEKAGFTERAEDVNYNLINGYADSSKSYEDYKSSTQEFYKRAEYWNVRGHLYELLVGANDGDFIERSRYLVEKLCSFLDKEELLYKASTLKSDVYTPNSNDSGGTVSRPETKVEKYWKTRIDALRTEINNTLQVIWNDVSYFHTTLVPLVYNYLRLYESTMEYISKGETFISALQKTSTEPNKSLGQSFDKVGARGFQRYSEGLSRAYDYFVKARQRRDSSKYKDNDDNNIYLRKYYQHEVLTACNFFSKSEEFLNKVKDLRSRLDI
jgi:hypothetical protein